MSRPRAGDDFAAIRARMEESRREREQAMREDRIELSQRQYRHAIRQAVLERAELKLEPPGEPRRGSQG